MADAPSGPPRTEIHLRDRDYTLYLKKRGAYTILVPAGRHSDSLLGVLVETFLKKPGYLAVDLSRLDAVTLPLVRALCEYAAGFGPAEGRVVLLHPPDRIRNLVKLMGRQDLLPVALSEGDLEGAPEQVEERLRRGQERIQLVRAMLQANPCWQLVDPESRWLCPFCVTFRPTVRFVAKGSPTLTVIEGIARHLSSECSTYTEGSTDGWPFEVLERVVTRAAAGEKTDTKALLARAEFSRLAPGLHPEAAPLGAPDERRRRLLPTVAPAIPGCTAEICYRAAPRVSGDFYDFVRLRDGRVAVVVGDVSGHGIEAGVFMGMARKTLSLRLRESADLAEALLRANDDLCSELEGESFVTAAVAVIDGEKREISIARAGHPAPFLVRAGPPPTVERVESAGPVLGLVPAASFEQGVEVVQFVLAPGDSLFLHTDGLEELRDAEGVKFGADRVGEILRANADREAGLLLGTVIVEAEQFSVGSERGEDVTAVCLKLR